MLLNKSSNKGEISSCGAAARIIFTSLILQSVLLCSEIADKSPQ